MSNSEICTVYCICGTPLILIIRNLFYICTDFHIRKKTVHISLEVDMFTCCIFFSVPMLVISPRFPLCFSYFFLFFIIYLLFFLFPLFDVVYTVLSNFSPFSPCFLFLPLSFIFIYLFEIINYSPLWVEC